MSSAPEPGVLLVAAAWAGRGGLQNQLAELAGLLASERPVTVLTWAPRAWPRRVRRAPGVDVLTVPSLLAWDRDHAAVAAALNTVVSLATGVLGAVVLGRRRWGVACAAGLQPEATVAVLAALGSRRRVVVRTWLVGRLGNAERLRRSLAAPLVLYALRRADAFAVETREAGEELAGLGLSHERVHVLPLGVDLERFRPRAGHTGSGVAHAVFTGRFDLRQKRLDLLLDGWERAGLDGWELVVAGDGPDAAWVRRRAAAIPRVTVLPWQEDPAPLLAAGDLFVLPTEAETSALAMLEGMASGLPGLVSRLDGMEQRAPDGVRLVPNDPEAWAAALRDIDALAPVARGEEGRRARAWAERHADAARLAPAWARLLAP